MIDYLIGLKEYAIGIDVDQMLNDCIYNLGQKGSHILHILVFYECVITMNFIQFNFLMQYLICKKL